MIYWMKVRKVTDDGFRTLVTTLTKRMAEDLTEYMHEHGHKSALYAFRYRYD